VANPFAQKRWYSKISNVLMAPVFRFVPMPHGFVLLTVTGRRSGKPRHRPVRAVEVDGTHYAVALLGERADWLRNVRVQPRVRVKVGGRTQDATVREVSDPAEVARAGDVYVNQIDRYDYVDYPNLEWGWPSKRNIVDAHRRWLERGVLVAIDLDGGGT
jgi:deazaflavin-dependent oxidoreductase (nitroreductase family)